MKNIILTSAALFSLIACQNKIGYQIDGSLNGEGLVYLMSGDDTLAQAEVKNNSFSLSGKTDEMKVAYISWDEESESLPIFLENKKYTVNIDTAQSAINKVIGDENQALLNSYFFLSDKDEKELKDLYNKLRTAYKNGERAYMDSIYAIYDGFSEKKEKNSDSVMNANLSSPVAGYMLLKSSTVWEFDKLNEAYNSLADTVKNTPFGKKIDARLKKMESVLIGKTAPDFTLNTPDGTALSLFDINGKVKIIDFWASWCGPCRRLNPEMVKIYKEYHPKGLEILGVSLDENREQWIEAIQKDNLEWNHVSDLKGWKSEAGQLYGINFVPNIIVLDENNVIVARNIHGEDLEAKIKELINK